jgi:hypothetical protein
MSEELTRSEILMIEMLEAQRRREFARFSSEFHDDPNCLSLTRASQLASGSSVPEPEETRHLSGCYACRRLIEKFQAADHTSVEVENRFSVRRSAKVMRISVESLPYAAAAQGEVTVGQLTPGRYQIKVQDVGGQGLRAQIEIQPYAGALRVRHVSGHKLVLRDTAARLSSKRWATINADSGSLLSVLLQEQLRMEASDVSVEDET